MSAECVCLLGPARGPGPLMTFYLYRVDNDQRPSASRAGVWVLRGVSYSSTRGQKRVKDGQGT